ncbi:hypothetical protein G6L26_017025 [Agrobacterium radiobacter]|uniref:Uncharacterized protein n=1 Tax=Agrobacterium tumefaciens str. B6 TaxID=1183423 RepID=A0A822V226_AGRTU|nr:hypothetical protein [Agrobacterium tumefaciens]QNP81549.1 hypothetical protein IAI05_16340 [Agrobacterium tumefaciens]CVI21814.1 conserved exported hypothetical protein [Agrobacterium tumefaciens str. B6]SPZ46605.1 conserved exported protein of uncharacterised function [Agrobacterium tumefaciens]
MKRLFYCLFLLVAIAHPALSRDLSPAEQDSLRTRIERFSTALNAQDFELVGTTVPPKIFEFIARDAGVSVEQLRGALTTQMQMALAAVKITEFTMDTQAITLAQTPDGTPYALVPTKTVMETGGQTIEAKSHTLALMDGADWYLLRVSDQQQVTILRKVYPSFAEVEFPDDSMQPVK